ncbi:MAG: hypothetical protein AABZ31_09705 [Bdellovibrionota bacterium]
MFAFLMALGLANFASAAAPEVKIESFYYTGNTSQERTAELCGGVYPNPGAGMFVSVTVDPRSKKPGVYTVATSAAGKFCTLVMTFTGTASADAAGFAPTAVVNAQIK